MSEPTPEAEPVIQPVIQDVREEPHRSPESGAEPGTATGDRTEDPQGEPAEAAAGDGDENPDARDENAAEDGEGAEDADEAEGGDEAEDGPQPLGVRLEPTGHGPVDARLRRLQDADGIGVAGHPEVYEEVHRGLRETLEALDRAGAAQPGPPQPSGPPGAQAPSHGRG